MHHLGPEKAATDFAKDANSCPLTQGHLLVRIKTEEAQCDLTALVGGMNDHLPARPELHFIALDNDFKLHYLAAEGSLDGRDPGFVLVAQRQMHQQIGLALGADLVK